MAQVTFTDSNLPIIVIETFGEDIEDDPRIIADMGIIWNADGERNDLTDSFNNYEGRISIEIRGSTSQQYPKKSYGLETQDEMGNNLDVSLLGLPAENDWILYGAYPDKSLMRNELTYALFGEMQEWSPRTVYCELVINGDYKGVYSLVEKIKRDTNRIDIATLNPDELSGDDLTGGYIIKVDKSTGSSSTPWFSPFQPKVQFLYHDPKYEELDPIQRDYIEEYVTAFETAVYGPDFDNPYLGYRAYIDVESFIDFMLMQELGRTVDGYRSSSFLYKDKDSNGGKLRAGPMWDFNLSYGNANYCDSYLTTGWQYNFVEVCSDFPIDPPEWWERLQDDPNFNFQLQCRWNSLRSSILSEEYLNAWIDSAAALLDESQERNFERWDILGEYVNWNYIVWDTWEEEIDYLKDWLEDRLAYMDAELPGGNCSFDGNPKDPADPDIVSGIMEEGRPLSVFPNPTSGVLYTSALSDMPLRLFSADGRELFLDVHNGIMDLSPFPSGLYLLIMGQEAVRIVKE
jgi:hypothetical protein